MSRSKPKIEVCERCHDREAAIFPMVVRDGKLTPAQFCRECYSSASDMPRSLQEMIDDLEGKPRKERKDEK